VAATKSTSVRVGERTYEQVRQLGAQSGRSITQVIEDAVAEEARRVFWCEFHEAVERLRADPDAWAAYKVEQRELEGTLMDGLDPDDDWAEQFNAPPEAFTFAEDAGSEASDGITVGQHLEADVAGARTGADHAPRRARAPRAARTVIRFSRSSARGGDGGFWLALWHRLHC
jgi:hypothetical protein